MDAFVGRHCVQSPGPSRAKIRACNVAAPGEAEGGHYPPIVYIRRRDLSAITSHYPNCAARAGYSAEVAVDNANQVRSQIMNEERPEIWFGMSTAPTAALFLLAFIFIRPSGPDRSSQWPFFLNKSGNLWIASVRRERYVSHSTR